MKSLYGHEIVLKHLQKDECVFVFPSESAASAHADLVLKEKAAEAVRLDRFIAWDSFKSRSIKAQRGPELKSAGAEVRKLFAARLLQENEQGGKSGALFYSLIPAAYAAYSRSFASWIAEILPQLALWAEKIAGSSVDAIDAMEFPRGHINYDLQTLLIRYRDFLNARGFFESAWERPPFRGGGKRYFIFYPQALADFTDYENLLAKAASFGEVTLVPPPDTQTKPEVFFYHNAQAEIAAAALYILNLRNTGSAYQDIIVSVPSLDDYAPYIKQEFANRNIPLSDRNGKKLSDYQAGRLFSCMRNCYTSGFSFASVVDLLTNHALPWKEKEQITRLIDFGLKNSCICSWEEEDGKKIDVWKASHFDSEDTAVFYADLNMMINRICGVKTFAGIKKYYFAFRSRFLDMEAFNETEDEADNVISRCIAELEHLDALCTSVPELAVKNPFQFFIRHISETVYMPQAREGGVLLLPYRIAAAFPAAYHIILGANQNDMAQTNSRLDFLSRFDRARARIPDENASELFYKLHIACAGEKAVFFCSEETFTGFAIPFSLLEAGKPRAPAPAGNEDFAPDLMSAEREWFAPGDANAANGAAIHAVQKNGFEQFALRNSPPPPSARKDSGRRFSLSNEALRRFGGDTPGLFTLSASSLRPFFQCSLFWLYNKVLNIQEHDMEARIFDPAVWGNLYHLILNDFFNTMLSNNTPLLAEKNNTLPSAPAEKLNMIVDDVFENIDTRLWTSTIKKTLIIPQKEVVKNKLFRLAGNLFSSCEGARVLFVEQNLSFRMPSFVFDFDTQNIEIYWNGKPDLALETPAGGIVIVDFKSGALPVKDDCFGQKNGILLDFQMPLYRALIEAALGRQAQAGIFAGVKDAKARFYFAQGKKEREKTVSFETVEPLLYEQANAYVKSVLTGSINEYINKRYTVCLGCAYKNICRTTFTVQKGGGFYDS